MEHLLLPINGGIMITKQNPSHLKHTATHLESKYKFLMLVVIAICYLGYLSYKHDIKSGLSSLALTWSFFVLCTPVADAGFLLDFPIRILFGIRMFIVEIFVWLLASIIAAIFIFVSPQAFEITVVTSLFYKILSNPIPYWSIIALCCIGTFGSIYFGDEMLDALSHSKRRKFHKHYFKHKNVILFAVIVTVVLLYHQLIKELGLNF